MKISIGIYVFVLVLSKIGGTLHTLQDSSANTRDNGFPNADDQFRTQMLESDDERPKRPLLILVPRQTDEENSISVEEQTEALKKNLIRRRKPRCKTPSVLRKRRRATPTKYPREYRLFPTSRPGKRSIGSTEGKPYFRLVSVKNAQYHLRNLLRSRITKRTSKDGSQESILQPRDQDSVVLIGKETTKSVDQDPKKYVCYCVDENESAKQTKNPTTPYAIKTKLQPNMIGKSIYRDTESSLKSSGPDRYGRIRKPSTSTSSFVSEPPMVRQSTRINIPFDRDDNLDENSYGLENQTPSGKNVHTTIQQDQPRVATIPPTLEASLNGLQDTQNYLGSEPINYDEFEPIPIGPNIVYPAPYMIYPQLAQYPQFSQYHLYDSNVARDGHIHSDQLSDQSPIVGQVESACDSYIATPFGKNFVDIDECIRLYGRDNCIVTSTSRLSINDAGNNDEENDGSMIGSKREKSSTNEWKSTTNPYKVEEATNYNENFDVTRDSEGEAVQQSEAFSQDRNQQLPITTSRHFTDGSRQLFDDMESHSSTTTNRGLVGSAPYQNYDDPKTSPSDSDEIADYTESLEESEINKIPKKVTNKMPELPRLWTSGMLGNVQAAHGRSSVYLEMTAKPSDDDINIEDSAEINHQDAASSDYLGLTNYGTTEHSHSSNDIGNVYEVTTDHHELTSPLNNEYSIDDDREERVSNKYGETSLGNSFYTTQSAINVVRDNEPKITMNGNGERFVSSHNSFLGELSRTTTESYKLGMPVSHSPSIYLSTTTERFGRSSQNPSKDEFNLERELEEIDVTEDTTNDCETEQSILGEKIVTEMTFAPDDLPESFHDKSRNLSEEHQRMEKPYGEVVGQGNDASKDYYDEMTNQPYEESQEELGEETHSSTPIVSNVIHESSSIYPNVLSSKNKMVEQTSTWVPEATVRNVEEAIVGNTAEFGEDYDEILSSEVIPKENIIPTDNHLSGSTDRIQGNFSYDIVGNLATGDSKNVEEQNSSNDAVLSSEYTEEISEDDLTPEDETFLRTAVEKVLNDLISENSNSMEDGAHQPEVVGLAQLETLSGISDSSVLKNLFTLPAVREMAINTIRDSIDRTRDSAQKTSLGRLSDETIGSVFDYVIRDILPGKTQMLSSLMFVNEDQHKNGQWSTRSVNLGSNDKTVGQEYNDEISNHIESIIGHPGIGLERAKLPSVQNIIVRTVANALKKAERTVDHSAILDALRNIIARAETSSVNSHEKLSRDGQLPGIQDIESSYDSIENLPIVPVTEHIFKDGHWLEKQTIVGNTRKSFEPKIFSSTTSRRDEKLTSSTLSYDKSNIKTSQYGSTSGAMDYALLGDSESNEDDNLMTDYQVTEEIVEVPISTAKSTLVISTSENNENDIQNIPTKYYSPNSRMMAYIKNQHQPEGTYRSEEEINVGLKSPTTEVPIENYSPLVGMISTESSTVTGASEEFLRTPGLSTPGDSTENVSKALTTDYRNTDNVVGMAESLSISTNKTPATSRSKTNEAVARKNLRKPGGGKLGSGEPMKATLQSSTAGVTIENDSPSVAMRARESSTTTETSVKFSRTPELSTRRYSGENVGETLTTDYRSTDNVVGITKSLSTLTAKTPAISKSKINDAAVWKNLRKPGGGKLGSGEPMKVTLQSSPAGVTIENDSPSVGMRARESSTTTEAAVKFSQTPELSSHEYSDEDVGETLNTDYWSMENVAGVTHSLSSSRSTTPAISKSYTNQEENRRNTGKYYSPNDKMLPYLKNLRKPGGGKSTSEEAMRIALQSSTTENYSHSAGMGPRQFSTTTEASMELSRTPGHPEKTLGATLNIDYQSTDDVGMTESRFTSPTTTPTISRSKTDEANLRKNLRKPEGGKLRSKEGMKGALQSPMIQVTTENYSPSVEKGSRQFAKTAKSSVQSRAPGLSTAQDYEENLGEILATDYESTDDVVEVAENLSSSTPNNPAFSRTYTNQKKVTKVPSEYYSSNRKMLPHSTNPRKSGGGKLRSEETTTVALQSPTTKVTSENYDSPSVGMKSRGFSTTTEAPVVEFSRTFELNSAGHSVKNLAKKITTDFQSIDDAVGMNENLSSFTTPAFSRGWTDEEDVRKTPTIYDPNTIIKATPESIRSDLITVNYSSSVKSNSRKFSPATEPSVRLAQTPESYSDSATSTKKLKTRPCVNNKKKNNLERVGSSLNNYRTNPMSSSSANDKRNYSKQPIPASYSDIQLGADNVQSTTENYVGEKNSPEPETQRNFNEEITGPPTELYSANHPSTLNNKNQQFTNEQCVCKENQATTETMEGNGGFVENTQSPMSQSTPSDIYRNEVGESLTSANFDDNGDEEIYDGLMELSENQHSYADNNNRHTTEEYFATKNIKPTEKLEESENQVAMTESSMMDHLLYDDDDEITPISSTEKMVEESNYSGIDEFGENSKKVVQDSPISEIFEAENYENIDQGVTKSGYTKNGKNTRNQLGLINREGGSTVKKIQKFTKNPNYPYSVAEVVTKKSIGEARSQQDNIYLEEFPSEKISRSQDETSNSDEVALSTNGGSNYVNPVYDPTYFGKITLNSLNPDNDKISDLTNTDLFYVGDGVKIPLKITRTRDGAWALSISEKICENYVKQKCACCVPTDGNIVEERTEISDIEDEPKKRWARSTSAGEIVTTIATPVEKFAIQYDLSLDPTDCRHESTKSWRQMKSKPTTEMKNNSRNSAKALRDGNLLKLFQNNNQIQRDTSDEIEDQINEDNDKAYTSKASNALVRTELTFDANTDEFIESLKHINEAPEGKRAKMVAIALDDLINSASAQNLNPILESYSVDETTEEDSMKDRLGDNDDRDLIEIANEMAKYGYQKDNPIWERIRLIKKKQDELRPYRYQRNIDRQVAGRMDVVKTVLGWLKQVVLESKANDET